MNSTVNQAAIIAEPSYVYPWMPDQGDGTYRNPVLYADYSDPDVIRHEDDFWMTASSFNCTPGLPILHSRDLVNWTLVNHAVNNVPGERYDEVQPGAGIWAPSIRFHDGKFWIFFPTPDEGIYAVTADDPAGRWSEPWLVQAGKGLIDPCPLWDDDGKAYLIHAYAHSRSGLKDRLRIVPMSPNGERLIGEGRLVFHEPERHPTMEGPKLLKRAGWYYILAPAGGVATGWQTVLRSRSIFGPYEDRIVLEQGGTAVNGPHQGALVDTPAGSCWFLHFQDTGVYGRVVHLQPVTWRDGWPLMGELNRGRNVGEPVLHHRKPNLPAGNRSAPVANDEFNAATLGLQWQWQANHRADWHSLSARPGWLRLFAQPGGGDLTQAPQVLLQKFPARSFAVETRVTLERQPPGAEAGLVVMGQAYGALALRSQGQGTAVVFRTSAGETTLGNVSESDVVFRVEVADGGLCRFSCRTGGGNLLAAPAAFQARPGKWIGAKLGIYCTAATHTPAGAFADFDYLRWIPTLLQQAE